MLSVSEYSAQKYLSSQKKTPSFAVNAKYSYQDMTNLVNCKSSNPCERHESKWTEVEV